MQAFRMDGGGEFCKSTGIRQEFTPPSTPQQNGIVERANRTIVEGVRAMLTGRGLPASLWADAAQHFVNIRNVCPRESLGGKTPYEAFTGKRPHYNNIHVFGAPTWYWVKKEDRKGKLANSRARGYFLGIWENLDEQSTSMSLHS